MRFFEEVAAKHLKHPGVETVLPQRGTKASAGHDFRVKDEVVLEPGEYKLIFTDVKAFFPDFEVLKLYMRSSGPLGLVFKNGTGIIDADYYGNPKNDGNIGLPLWNIGKEKIVIECGERVAQGIFQNYYTTNDEPVNGNRISGFGSTGK